jgi:hypothetical protein
VPTFRQISNLLISPFVSLSHHVANSFPLFHFGEINTGRVDESRFLTCFVESQVVSRRFTKFLHIC